MARLLHWFFFCPYSYFSMESLCWLCRYVGVRSRNATKGIKLNFPCVVDSYFGIGVLVGWVFCRCIVSNSEE